MLFTPQFTATGQATIKGRGCLHSHAGSYLARCRATAKLAGTQPRGRIQTIRGKAPAEAHAPGVRGVYTLQDKHQARSNGVWCRSRDRGPEFTSGVVAWISPGRMAQSCQPHGHLGLCAVTRPAEPNHNANGIRAVTGVQELPFGGRGGSPTTGPQARTTQ